MTPNGKSAIFQVKFRFPKRKDFIDDEDAYPGLPFTRYFADLIGSGTNVPWEDVL